jgi:hypothetical protein
MVYNKIMKFSEHTGELKKGQGKPNENFIRENGAKDRFGNQYITSKEFSYFDNAGQENSAGILISPDGQKFIADNPRILHDIEKGLISFANYSGNIYDFKIDLGQGRSLQFVVSGSQSQFYILKINDQKYAIKVHLSETAEGHRKIDQPYINEMLQTQAVAADLKNDLERLGIKMSSFLFASGQVSCTKYEEEGDRSNVVVRVVVEKITELFNLVDRYINGKKKERNPLWNHIEIDFHMNPETMFRNFIFKKDGSIVWIDPFLYQE